MRRKNYFHCNHFNTSYCKRLWEPLKQQKQRDSQVKEATGVEALVCKYPALEHRRGPSQSRAIGARWGEGHEEPSSAGGWQPCSGGGEVLLRGCPLLGMLGKRIQWATCVGGQGGQSYRWCLILTKSTFAFALDDVFEDHVMPRREGGRCLVLLKARPRLRGGGGRSEREILLRRQRGR